MTIDTVLLEPQEGGNLGSICRGLKTLGFTPPVLVSAHQGIERSPEARRLAHGAREYLGQLRRFETLDDALEEYSFILGTTARKRRTVSEYIELRMLSSLLRKKGEAVSRIALLFGSEASGLPSSALRRCHLVSTIPLRSSYPSLNLAQAVLLYAYELAPLLRTPEEAAGSYARSVGARTPEYRALLERVERLLSERRVNEALLGRVRERLAHVEEGDVALIHSILNALER
ncbi:MAG: TrmH family RNA methyltransferase [Alkalispirochaetaceae bacterium]